MWDNFHRTWIYGLMLACLVSCFGCSGNIKEAQLVHKMAGECRGGMSTARVHKEDDETDVYVGCK